MAKKFYITTAIDYPSGLPHIGHAYEKIIADTIARYKRLKGFDVHFLTGTDEHGQKIMKKAKEAGKEPQAYVDGMSEHFRELCRKLDISNDDFIRTTEERHKKSVLEVYKRVKAKGDVYKGQYSGLYCVDCETYYLEKDLKDGKCPVHGTSPDNVSEESYFFRMSKYHDAMKAHIKTNPDYIQPDHKAKEILNRLENPLNDLSVSRTSFPWGIPLPDDDKHVMYVWMDALTNYISALGFPEGEKFKKYWPADIHLIGKDILWHHTVIWGSILMSADVPLPKKILVHGFVNVEGEKISKALGNIVDPINLIDTFGTDAVRYFLLREAPLGEDLNYTQESLVERINADLANDLGNLLNRTVVMVGKYFEGTIPQPEGGFALEKRALSVVKDAGKLFDQYHLSKALAEVWKLAAESNKFINEREPWKLAKEGRLSELGTTLYELAECLRILSILVYPVMPSTAERMRKQLGLGNELNWADAEKYGLIKAGTKTGQPEILFKKIESGKA